MKKGFTLVELAIVIVVLGILVSGVVAGQSIIESSKVNSVISDIQKYKTAIRAFELEYDGLPGDFNEAEDYWGSISGNCLTNSGSGTETCNGDNDGTFDYMWPAHSDSINEPWRAWQHMANAEILPGKYSGISSGDCSHTTMCSAPGENTPEGPFSGSSWHLHYYGNDINWKGKNKSRNVLALSNHKNGSGANWIGPALKTKHQKKIDEKIDDGKPYLGKVVTSGSLTSKTYSPNCTDGLGRSSTYRLSEDDPACLMFVDID